MQIDIASHIEKLLFEHETLIVPTFGGFTATRSAAAVDFVGGTVAPPAKTLAFNENLTVDDGILVHEISSTHAIGNEDARKFILEFVDKTKEALNQREIVTLPGIGRLYKNYAQKIQFLPDTTNFNTDSFGLPPLQFSPLGRARESAEPAPNFSDGNTGASAGTAAATTQQASAPSEAAAAPVPAAVAAAPNPAPPPPPLPYVNRTRPSNPMRSMAAFITGLFIFATAVGLYLMKRSRDAKANQQQEAVVETRETPSPAILPGPGGLIAEAEKAAEATQKAENEKNKPAVSNDDGRNDDTADEVEEAAAKKQEALSAKEKSAKKAASDEDKTAPLENGDKRCVLVVGTYQNKANATKLIERLRANGYDTYYRMQKGHQVGIEFNYKDLREIQEKINALQKLTGEDDIWIKKK